MEQQQQAGDGAGSGSSSSTEAALAEHPSAILEGLTATDINKMKAREGGRALGASGHARRHEAGAVWSLARTHHLLACVWTCRRHRTAITTHTG
jgi:hypothetical protein